MFDFESKIQHWINRLSFQLRAEAVQRFKQAGLDLSAEEWALLMVLWRDGPTPMADLANLTLRDRTTMTRLVDRMVKKDLVKRTTPKTDRRKVIIAVSTKGAEIKPRVLEAIQPLIAKSQNGIPEEDIALALNVLAQIAKNLDS